ncbi:MAG: YbaB/EbfC family nucleoid-associated protein [Micromonosporaceae bacterium]|nr:YbaB/EbfC family nucleoid-associated protein [Micromonosporaceae bacterium]
MFGFDPDDAHRRIDDWQATLVTRAARAEQLAAHVRTLRAEGSDPDRAVQATVDHNGRLLELTISERARDWPMSRIAEAVRVAVTMAQEAVVELTRRAVAEAGFGDDD